jgi:hypothetical protein
MLRYLYRVIIRFHPPSFRERFGDEMLSIFESTKGASARFGLLFDCLISSTRQWVLRPDFQAEGASAISAPDSIPSFTTLDGFRPRTSAVIDGVVLSAALFVLTCFAIRDSWIRVLNVRIPEYPGYLGINVAKNPSALRGSHKPQPQRSPNADDQSALISEHLQVDVMPVEAGPAVPTSPGIRGTAEILPSQPQIAGTEMTLQLPLESYAGTYKSRSPQMTIKIAVKSGQLSMHIVGESPRKLSPVSETEFATDGAGNTRIEFVPAQNGEMVQLRLSRDGQQITADRQ